jgi:hypothetical protein
MRPKELNKDRMDELIRLRANKSNSADKSLTGTERSSGGGINGSNQAYRQASRLVELIQL